MPLCHSTRLGRGWSSPIQPMELWQSTDIIISKPNPPRILVTVSGYKHTFNVLLGLSIRHGVAPEADAFYLSAQVRRFFKKERFVGLVECVFFCPKFRRNETSEQRYRRSRGTSCQTLQTHKDKLSRAPWQLNQPVPGRVRTVLRGIRSPGGKQEKQIFNVRSVNKNDFEINIKIWLCENECLLLVNVAFLTSWDMADEKSGKRKKLYTTKSEYLRNQWKQSWK